MLVSKVQFYDYEYACQINNHTMTAISGPNEKFNIISILILMKQYTYCDCVFLNLRGKYPMISKQYICYACDICTDLMMQ